MNYTLVMHETFSTSQSIENTFNYIVDFSHIDEWDHTIVNSEKIGNSPIALGTCFDLMFAMGKRQVPIAYQITEYDSPTRAVLIGKSQRFVATDTVSIEERENGCHVTWHAEIVFTGLSALIVPLMAKKIKAVGAQTIRDLHVILDQKPEQA